MSAELGNSYLSGFGLHLALAAWADRHGSGTFRGCARELGWGQTQGGLLNPLLLKHSHQIQSQTISMDKSEKPHTNAQHNQAQFSQTLQTFNNIG